MTPREKVIKITSILGMKYATASEAMGIVYGTFTNKLNNKVPRHCFNDKNVEDLKKFIVEKAEKIAEI